MGKRAQDKREIDWARKDLHRLKSQGLFRSLQQVEEKSRSRVKISGQGLINFCSNDYLGLANNPRVIASAEKALRRWGASASASRLVSGNFSLHLELEARLARFKGTEACLVFPAGYLANLGTIPALAGKDDLIFSDELNHASLIDACRLSRAKTIIFPHSDLQVLKKNLSASKPGQRKLIVLEAIYSMEGDLAPLPEVLELAEDFGAMVYLDEAHSTGVLGERGKGALEFFGIKEPPTFLILMGTLSKALASQGGFICCSKELREYLINTARSFIFSTGLNPPALGAGLKALEIIEQEPERIARLQRNIRFAREALFPIGLKISPDPSPILPIIIGDPIKTVRLSQKLFQKGLFVQAIRPPSVPKGKSRLRISISALHTQEEISKLINALGKILGKKSFLL